MMPKESSNPKPKPSGSSHTRIVIENVYESRADPNDGAAAQMTLLFFTTRPFWPRASKLAASCFTTFAQGGGGASRSPRHFPDRDAISHSEVWFAKVVCTLFVRSSSVDTCLGCLGKSLNPSVAFEVIRRLNNNNNPQLGLKFFELGRLNFGLVHSFRTYDLLMRSLCHMGLHDSAKFVFDCMKSDGHSPDTSIIEFLVSSYARVGKLDTVEKVLDEMKRDGVSMSPLVYNSVLNVLVRRNQVAEAVCLFRKHRDSHFRPDVWTFNILIRGLCGAGDVHVAFEVLSEMEKFGCSPDSVTVNTLINGLCKANEVERAHKLLRKLLMQSSNLLDVRAFTSVISGYCKLGRMEEVSSVFDEMTQSGIRPNEFTFNALINGFCKARDMALAVALFEKMPFYDCCPDVVTFTSLIDGHCRVGKLNEGLRFWHEMNRRKVSPNGYTFTILIHALCRDNRLQEARDFLRQLNRSNIVSKPFMYNPVIDGFCKAGNVDEANTTVAEMEAKGCNPDKITFTILIIGNCMKGRMPEAICLFNKMLTRGLAPDTLVVNNLVSFLNKAGMPSEASHVRKIVTEGLALGMQCSGSIHLTENSGVPVAAI